MLRALGLVDQVKMAFVGIWREVGEIDRVVFRGKAKTQHPCAKGCGDTKPFLAVVGGAYIVMVPSPGIRRFAGIDNGYFAWLVFSAIEAEVKPLEKIRVCVLADPQLDITTGLVDADDFDIAGVEIGRDLHVRKKLKDSYPSTRYARFGVRDFWKQMAPERRAQSFSQTWFFPSAKVSIIREGSV